MKFQVHVLGLLFHDKMMFKQDVLLSFTVTLSESQRQPNFLTFKRFRPGKKLCFIAICLLVLEKMPFKPKVQKKDEG